MNNHDRDKCDCPSCVEYREEIRREEKHEEMLHEYEKFIEGGGDNDKN